MTAVVLSSAAVSGSGDVMVRLLSDCVLCFRRCFGDMSTVVGAVVAVRGRSLDSPDAAVLDVVGFLSWDSMRVMRYLSS